MVKNYIINNSKKITLFCNIKNNNKITIVKSSKITIKIIVVKMYNTSFLKSILTIEK